MPKTPPLVLLETDKSQYRGDDDVVLDITLENTYTKPVFFDINHIEAFYSIEVVDSQGRKISRLPYSGGRRGGEPWGLSPGQKKKGHVYLNRMFDLLTVGKYTVTVSNIGQLDKIPVSSKPVGFEITSARPLGDWN